MVGLLTIPSTVLLCLILSPSGSLHPLSTHLPLLHLSLPSLTQNSSVFQPLMPHLSKLIGLMHILSPIPSRLHKTHLLFSESHLALGTRPQLSRVLHIFKLLEWHILLTSPPKNKCLTCKPHLQSPTTSSSVV